ncbi:helix-turn-helix domain-containing protein [Anabaena sp. WFMT]|uniref:helix-turn-helix domain-containing protein n=1 Tax=Anabaena sp. WFMT TaxID=3449730 RepID=UPI003F238053
MSTRGNILAMATPINRTNRGKKKEAAFSLFARGYSHPEIAKEIGISTRTLSRWKADYENQISSQPKADSEIVISAQNDISQRINDLLDIALDSLEDILDDKESRKADKLRAIAIIGDWARLGRVSKQEELEEKNRFPMEIAEAQANLAELSDSELKKLYFEKLQESNG